ncbi:MAG TPA: LacI family DNA-binding transcriptional regulator [Verrucomicrobiae bacterium]|nr:LacI family DNA-binding transcriptional regulator [Verrucomicrobiae bacterium]
MSSKKQNKSLPRQNGSEKKPTLRFLAEQLDLTPATISMVVNRAPGAKAIPKHTQRRVLDAAKRFHYRPNFFARSLLRQRTFTIGVLIPEISDGYGAQVMRGIEDHLLQAGYFYFVVSHHHRPDLICEYPRLLLDRSVEGLIAVDTPMEASMQVPVVSVSGHGRVKGITNVVLHHGLAAKLALEHLATLGHRRLAVIKGQEFSSDTEARWNAIRREARRLSLEIDHDLVVALQGDTPSSHLGQEATEKLLASGKPFTALFTFNDLAAIGAIRALRLAGRSVPEDVSVIGFDDIPSAEFHNPPLTTVRQPLATMGEMAAASLLSCLTENRQKRARVIYVDPQLVVRGTTARVGVREIERKRAR